MDNKVQETIYPLHSGTVNVKVVKVSCFIHYQLLCQEAEVLMAPVLHVFNFLQVSLLIFIRDQAHYYSVISKFDNGRVGSGHN